MMSLYRTIRGTNGTQKRVRDRSVLGGGRLLLHVHIYSQMFRSAGV